VTARELPPFELGYPRTELRRKLVEAVLRGEKTATSSLLTDYELEQEALPRAGELSLLHDCDDQPVAVIETTEVRVVRAADIGLAFARDEGEGFTSVGAWRSAHEAFWKDSTITDETLIVAERFLVVERL
jgi:uncharacterized protein YhfF